MVSNGSQFHQINSPCSKRCLHILFLDAYSYSYAIEMLLVQIAVKLILFLVQRNCC
ncbi:hypothetical protein JHK87_009806 [Glycine soja]|nr:hypothetical protein JHK87_009806 [Glycine soja]